MQNRIKKTWNIVTTVLISLMVILAVLLWGFQFLGYEVLVVQSGSMEPAYHVGSLVYVQPVEPQELQVGDVITFELGGGVLGTHRIVEVQNENGSLSFVTKGDSNDSIDAAPVVPERIVGQVKFTIPKLGFLANYIQQPPGSYVVISVGALILLLTLLPDILFPNPNKKNNKKSLFISIHLGHLFTMQVKRTLKL